MEKTVDSFYQKAFWKSKIGGGISWTIYSPRWKHADIFGEHFTNNITPKNVNNNTQSYKYINMPNMNIFTQKYGKKSLFV